MPPGLVGNYRISLARVPSPRLFAQRGEGQAEGPKRAPTCGRPSPQPSPHARGAQEDAWGEGEARCGFLCLDAQGRSRKPGLKTNLDSRTGGPQSPRRGRKWPRRATGRAREPLNALYQAAYTTAHPSTCLPPHLPPVPAGGRIISSVPARVRRPWRSRPRATISAAGQARISGLISTRHGFGLPTRIIEILEAGHPVPDANSIAGAQRAIELAKNAGPNDLVLCLLSGGASAIWSAPVAGVVFEAKQALTKQLLKSGAPISEMNCVRKHLSRIKGGKLAAAVYPARLLTLAISDVPGDNPDEIGSGPTVADRSTLADARAVLAKWKITPSAEIARPLKNPAMKRSKPAIRSSPSSSYKIVAAPTASLEAAAQIARDIGYRVRILGDASRAKLATWPCSRPDGARGKTQGRKGCDHVRRRTDRDGARQRLGRPEPGIRARPRHRARRNAGDFAGLPAIPMASTAAAAMPTIRPARWFSPILWRGRGGKSKCRQFPGEQRLHGFLSPDRRSHSVRSYPDQRQRFPGHPRRSLKRSADVSAPKAEPAHRAASSRATLDLRRARLPARIGTALSFIPLRSAARADLKLCNATASRVGVAIGYQDNTGWATEGWWNIASQPARHSSRVRCRAASSTSTPSIMIAAANGAARTIMCTADKSFAIRGVQECYKRGYKRSGFFEVDTGEAKEWTIRLTDPERAKDKQEK